MALTRDDLNRPDDTPKPTPTPPAPPEPEPVGGTCPCGQPLADYPPAFMRGQCVTCFVADEDVDDEA